MKHNRIVLGVLSVLVLVLVAVSSGIFSSRGQEASRPNTFPKTTPTLSEIKRSFPSVDYNVERLSDPLRRAKGRKYDKQRNLNPEVNQDIEEVQFSEWLKSTTALPVSDSDVVILGTVVDSTAFLSENKRSVYTEVKIEIEKVFKNASKVSVQERHFLTAEREGGVVSFPHGFKTWYYVSGQSMPIVGERYLFFLTHNFAQFGYQDHDLFLLTAYHLKNGVVLPIDLAHGGTHLTATYYRGKSESVLLGDLSNALKAEPSSTPSKGRIQ